VVAPGARRPRLSPAWPSSQAPPSLKVTICDPLGNRGTSAPGLALSPNRQSCQFEYSAIRMRSRADAIHPELKFRALLTGGVRELELALV
jgi:hypothetical protein